MVEIIVAPSYDAMSRVAADVMTTFINEKPHAVIGLATGTTPLGMYQQLISDYTNKLVSFKDVRSYNLDEYCGLAPDHKQSYRYFMQQNLFDHIDIDPRNTFVPDGVNENADAVCDSYEQNIIDAGGIDLQLLGLGHNGHIGFNEPDDVFSPYTHVVNLSDSTIDANSRLFAARSEVPKRAYTMGIGTIMRAREILVIASGPGKASIVRDAFFGPITPRVPASVLQLHQNVTVVLDEEAASLCE